MAGNITYKNDFGPLAEVKMEDITLAQEEIKTLRKEIQGHIYRYHVLDDPIISDYEYDQLYKRLQELEGKYPQLITDDSPTQRSGSAVIDRFQKTAHPKPILSLANAFNKDEVRAWNERILKLDHRVGKSGFVMEPKIDGLTVVLHYENGLFVKGATRGDGEIGEDVTANLRTIRALPLKIPVESKPGRVPDRFVVRGEVYIKLKDFEELNNRLLESGEKTYQNPRNTASGSLRQLDSKITSRRPLNLLTYEIVDSSDGLPAGQWETLQHLKFYGFPTSELAERVDSIDEVVAHIDKWMNIRDAIPYEVDGVVIKLDDLQVARDLGVSGKDPRGAIALKYPAREVSTILNGIGINVGRTGVITPYAILQPVEVGGVTIRQATLHNFDFIKEKDIRIKDRVLVKRAGDVIPYVIGPLTGSRSGAEKAYEIPENCPSCGQKIEHLDGEVAYYCVNSSCPAQLVRNVEHFVSRGAMDIEGLGIKIVEQLIDARIVKSVVDLFEITAEQLLELEGFAEKKAENLLQSIKQARNQTLDRFIASLGIRGVGEVASNDLAQAFGTIDRLRDASLTDLQGVNGIGPNIALSIKDWFERPANQRLLERFKALGIWPVISTENSRKSGTALEGMTFVVTGTLPTLSREGVKELIEQNSGKTTDTVSRNTSYLVLGENPGLKLEKAKSLGIKILEENELLDLIRSRSQ